MAKFKLLLPKMGESVAEATIIKWTKNPGDYIEADETVMEIATDKVDSDVPSPVSGTLIEKLFNDNDIVQVGAVIAIIETDEPEKDEEHNIATDYHSIVDALPVNEESNLISEIQQPLTDAYHRNPVVEEETEQPVFEQHVVFAEPVPFTEQLDSKSEAKVDDSLKNTLRFYSPLVRNIAMQEGISNAELDQIPGTGADGRLTKDDLLNYIQNRYQPASAKDTKEQVVNAPAKEASGQSSPQLNFEAANQTTQPVAEKSKPEPTAQRPGEGKNASDTIVSPGDEIIEMDRMRRLIADHMVMSKHTSPHVTSFVEADVTNLVLWRENKKGGFEKREGEKITFTPIFIEAVVRAIKDMPMINVSVNGTQIIKKKDINISMATALPSGNLIVPVIKKADELNLVGLTKAVNDLAGRARNNKLKPDDVQGGTFTITNVGSFGNVMGTPIINQPQVAILAVGAIKKKPAVIETPQGDMIGIRHMMFLSLSYDHRVVDGALGGSFVRRVADYLENWDTTREI
ncbi:MAG TPA: dihydrolipoamide acetyltransferase family protein [Mucilaginibacter sp.]|jgi:2-oxoglutarate dehydrogenase E2 component (dihydrolipoamide succinyltransferase)